MEYFYCKLETERTEVNPLERKIDKSFLKKPFDDLLTYMMNSNGDENNPAYEGDDLTVLSQVNGVYNARLDSDSTVTLNAIVEDGLEEVEVSFEGKVCDYFERISQEIGEGEESGVQKISKQIYLVLKKDESGGSDYFK